MTESAPTPTFLLAQIDTASGKPVAYFRDVAEQPTEVYSPRQMSSASGLVWKITLDRSLARVFADEQEAQREADNVNADPRNAHFTVIRA